MEKLNIRFMNLRDRVCNLPQCYFPVRISEVVSIGETGQSIKNRQPEHQPCLRTGLLSQSLLTDHQQYKGHQILFDSSSIVTKALYFVNRKVRESVEISIHPNNINHDTDCPLPVIWRTVVQTVLSCYKYCYHLLCISVIFLL